MTHAKSKEEDTEDDHDDWHADDGTAGNAKDPHKSSCGENNASHHAFHGQSALCPHYSEWLLGNSTRVSGVIENEDSRNKETPAARCLSTRRERE